MQIIISLMIVLIVIVAIIMIILLTWELEVVDKPPPFQIMFYGYFVSEDDTIKKSKIQIFNEFKNLDELNEWLEEKSIELTNIYNKTFHIANCDAIISDAY